MANSLPSPQADRQIIDSLDVAIVEAFKANDHTLAVKLMRLKERKITGRRKVTGGSKASDIKSHNVRTNCVYVSRGTKSNRKASNKMLNKLCAKFA